jgi:hypothetical protein
MKKEKFLIAMLTICALLMSTHNLSAAALVPDSLSLNTTQTWRDYGTYKNYADKQCATAFLLTFRNKKTVTLKTIEILWVGNKLENLSASLYKKHKENMDMIPIEQNFIADGAWNKTGQKLTFHLQEKLVATSTYFLVVSFPPKHENTIRAGRFSLASVNHA